MGFAGEGRPGTLALGESVWCCMFRPLAPQLEAACRSGAQSAAVWMLFPAGSHSRRALCVGPWWVRGCGVGLYWFMGAHGHAGRDTPTTWAASGLGQLGLEADLFHLRLLLGSMGKSSSGEESLAWWGLGLSVVSRAVSGTSAPLFPRTLSWHSCDVGSLFLRLFHPL